MFNEEERKRIFDQIMNIWAIPEIERRKKKGILEDDFEIKRAQVIFTLGKPPEIKFNEEVGITAMIKVNRDIIKGEEVKYSDVDKIEKFIVDYPSNSGHITLFRILDNWLIIFDARYNKEKIEELIKRSKEFYESAKGNLEKDRLIPFYGHCWDSAELSAVCHSLITGGKNEGHGENVKNFVELSKLRNVDEGHAKILSELRNLNNLQYEFSTDLRNKDHEKFLKFVEEMIEEAEKLIKS
jgi:uncharacterized protein (UPF0332 family)